MHAIKSAGSESKQGWVFAGLTHTALSHDYLMWTCFLSWPDPDVGCMGSQDSCHMHLIPTCGTAGGGCRFLSVARTYRSLKWETQGYPCIVQHVRPKITLDVTSNSTGPDGSKDVRDPARHLIAQSHVFILVVSLCVLTTHTVCTYMD